jgi:hypothetical protein
MMIVLWNLGCANFRQTQLVLIAWQQNFIDWSILDTAGRFVAMMYCHGHFISDKQIRLRSFKQHKLRVITYSTLLCGFNCVFPQQQTVYQGLLPDCVLKTISIEWIKGVF